MQKKLAILGSTGSIGTQALNVVERYPDDLKIVSMAAGSNIDLFSKQVEKFTPKIVSVKGPKEADELSGKISYDVKIHHGLDGLNMCCLDSEVTSVLNGLVGAVGFIPTISSLKADKEVLLANKESLVMAGELIIDLLAKGNGSLVPVDSEHSAIYQCLDGRCYKDGVKKVILTASGGPFRNLPIEKFGEITIEQALAHPTWKMGPKISIDSASMMNKGLEIIEAHYLFNLPPERIEVVVHPSSIVHSFIEFNDNSLLAQLSHPSMEIPIQYALLGGSRSATNVKTLSLPDIGALEFFAPDPVKFPALNIAREALRKGGIYPAVFNAANEVAVDYFLNGKISFVSISKVVETVLSEEIDVSYDEKGILNADKISRELAVNIIQENFECKIK